jgi:ubiquinone/menaquinone biosynthesis C-methylase UbiE
MMAENNKEYRFFKDADMDRIKEIAFMTPIFDDMIGKYKFQSVLDYGCGNGIYGSYFKKQTGCNLVGVDGSEYGLKQAKEHGYDSTLHINDFCTERLPLQAGTFDLVMLKDILEHMLEPLFVLDEAARLLKEGGICLIHVPNHFPIAYRIKFLFTNQIDTQGYFPDSKEWNFPHIRFFTMQGLKEMFDSVGFTIIENYSDHFTTFCPVLSHLPFSKKFHRNLAKQYPDHFSYGYTFICKKKTL